MHFNDVYFLNEKLWILLYVKPAWKWDDSSNLKSATSSFFIQLFSSPLFKTTIVCVNANFRQVSDIFYALGENRTCSISTRLDQKSRRFLIFPRSILQNICTKWPPLLDLAAVKWVYILKTRIVVFLWSTSRNNWMGKLDCVNANIFHHTQKIWNDTWTKIGSCEPTFRVFP